MSRNKILPWLGLILAVMIGWFLVAIEIVSPVLVSVAGFSLLTMGLCWILAKDVEQEEKWVILILTAGFLLKLVYVLYTGIGTRQHDVHSFTDSTNGHAGYIRYLYTYGHLPDFDPRQEFQFYHPPLHHILSALWVSLNRLLGASWEQSWKSIQILTLFYSSACMILMYRLLRELSFRGLALLLPLAIFCLHPYMIFLAGSINNDMLSILFMLLTMLYTLRWSQKPCFRNIVILALFIGLGMSTKLSVAYLAPATALVFLWKLLHTPRWTRTLLPQFLVFALICLPLGLWWYIRCYLLFEMPLTYVPALSTESSQYLGDTYSFWSRLFDLSPEQFQYLYISYGENGATYLEHNIFLALLKSSVFEEQTLTRYNDSIYSASFLLFWSNIVLVAYSLYGMIRYMWRSRFSASARITLWVTYGLVFLSFIIFCYSYPHVCTQSYRYMVPTLFVGIVGIALYLEHARGWPRRIFLGASILFGVSSIAQFILLGV